MPNFVPSHSNSFYITILSFDAMYCELLTSLNKLIRRVAANVLNKQSGAADKGLSRAWGFGRVANNSLEKKIVTKCHKDRMGWY
jgi:hypothetical protein